MHFVGHLVNQIKEVTMTISFRAGNNYPTQNIPPQTQQQKNSIGLTENGQNVLNKTNEYANAYNLADTLVDSEKRKENLGNVVKNTMLMPIMSNPAVSTIYTVNQYKKGEISKDDATKIMIYNAIAQGMSS